MLFSARELRAIGVVGPEAGETIISLELFPSYRQ